MSATITKEDLKAYISDKKNVEDLNGRIAELEARLYDPRRAQITGAPMVRSAARGSPQERAADEYTEALDDLRLHYTQQRTKLLKSLLRIEEALAGLPSEYQLILRRHYVDGLSWDDTAERCYVSRRQATNLHNKALELLREGAAEA